jgi:hypothetical protein
VIAMMLLPLTTEHTGIFAKDLVKGQFMDFVVLHLVTMNYNESAEHVEKKYSMQHLGMGLKMELITRNRHI